MVDADLICASVVFISISLFSIFLIIKYLKWKRLIVTPFRPISEIAPGVVKVRGIAFPLPNGRLTSPITKRPCLNYYIRLSRFVNSSYEGQDLTFWDEISSIHSKRPFILDDTSGPVKVEPGDEINIMTKVFDRKGPSRIFFDGKYSDVVPLSAFRKRSLARDPNVTVRLQEYILEEGERLHMIGKVKKNRSKNEGFVPYVIIDNRYLKITKDERDFDRIRFIDALLSRKLKSDLLS